MGLWAKIKAALKKTKDAIAYRLRKLFKGHVIDDEFYDELEMTLISADIGAETTERLLDDLKKAIDKKHITKPGPVEAELKLLMQEILDENEVPEYKYPMIIMVVGVNGVGKTTAIGKLAHRFKKA